MDEKRTTLPGNFAKVLASGDLDRMIAVFDKCDANARAGRDGTNALGNWAAPPELMRWLVEHDADPNMRDAHGATPLSEQILARNLVGIQTLIELGADAGDVDSLHYSALKFAADNQRPQVVRMLLERPARRRLLSRKPVVPPSDVLEAALDSCANARIPETVETLELLLGAGSKVTARAREQVGQIGDRFERMRDAYNRESLPEADASLQKLYRLTGVTPVAAAVRHDGVSPIEVPPGRLSEQVDALWRLLVPGLAAAATAQGEAIRIVGRVASELQVNGGANWDADYRAMLKSLQPILGSGTPLTDEDLAEVGSIVRRLPGGNVDTLTDKLNAHVITWIRANPTPILLPSPTYDR